MRKLTFFFLVIVSLKATAQTDNEFKKLDQYFKLLEDHNKFMGGVAIYSNEDLLYEHYSGFVDVDQKQRADSITKYRIGSITKMFTAVLVFKQIELGRISLSSGLDQFYPTLPNAELINIGHLLRHQSGIHNFTNNIDYSEYMTLPKSRQELIEIISSQKPDFLPGEKMEYSNSNFVLLTFILEDITGKSYDELIKGLCDDLDLKHTKVGGKITPVENEAFSYKFEEGWQKQVETSMTIPLGAGALISTPRDLNQFIQKLFGGEVLADSLFNQMIEIEKGVGYGIFRFPFYNRHLLGHNGGIDGFRSNLAIYPDDKISIAVAGNGFDFNLNRIMVACLSEVFNRDYVLPDFSLKQVDVEYDVLKSLEGTYVSQKLPFKISLFLNDNKLMAQATGQAAFPLTSFDGGIFKFEAGGIDIVFKVHEDQILPGKFQLKQNGMTYDYQKE